MKPYTMAAHWALLLSIGLAGTARAQEAADAEPSNREAREADEPDEPKLSDRIKSVQRKVFLKRERVELAPLFAFSLNDPFFLHMFAGGSIGYHLSDAFEIEARGSAVIAKSESDAVRFVRQTTDSLLDDGQPELEYHAELDVLWSPIYGKISLFGEAILHFDTYIAAGAGVFGTDAGTNPAANAGIGQRYFINDWMVLRIEYRNYFFSEERRGESDLRTPGTFGIMLSFFLPTAFEYDFQ
ncbi:MAG: outer membrane beta-barrel domain-containing protein [Myxococcales bacterium]|nr:outer membrane beta-barrel domain-containing protein [Myxococcales bacterium]